MARKCSHCGKIGHNSRTCYSVGAGAIKLFGVKLEMATSPPISSSSSPSSSSSSSSYSLSLSPSSSSFSSPVISIYQNPDKSSITGYLSDGLTGKINNPERKKGVPWSEEEHRRFLAGLEKLGKGDWRGISRSFVVTKTPTQVASHAQKYFLRLSSLANNKRRSSLFDMVSCSSSSSNSGVELRNQEKDIPRRVGVWEQRLTKHRIVGYPGLEQPDSSGGPDLELKLAAPQPLATN